MPRLCRSVVEHVRCVTSGSTASEQEKHDLPLNNVLWYAQVAFRTDDIEGIIGTFFASILDHTHKLRVDVRTISFISTNITTFGMR